ncbi:unnamed protein product [Sphagnum balticum]
MRLTYEKKKFKEMKKYTYDYEGKLLAAAPGRWGVEGYKYEEGPAVEMGVSITELNSNSKVYGRVRNTEDKKTLKLSEFRELPRRAALRDTRRSLDNRLIERIDLQEGRREIDSGDRLRVRTQGTLDRHSVVLSSVGDGVSRGRIIIKNPVLYSDNFTSDCMNN